MVTAPPPPKLIPKSDLGISVWVLLLVRKFQFFQPLERILAELEGHGLYRSAGTVTNGFKRLVPLFEPLYEGLRNYNRDDEHWHADETRWRVFVQLANKVGFAWTLWLFASQRSVVFVLDPTRAHQVPEEYFGEDAHGILNVDRYKAYKAMAQVKAGQMILSFCWAHVRRDFLGVLTGWSELAEWAWSWVEEIATLYHRNNERVSLTKGTATYAQADQQVRAQVDHISQRCAAELAQPELRSPQAKVLTSLQEHWAGLTVFVDHPEVPMDNNYAERCQRGPVVGRKNFYGSGSLWSGRLAAILFSLFQTIELWGMDVHKWLTAYLTACAKAGGEPPPAAKQYLPWNMSPQQRAELGPPQVQVSDEPSACAR